jgi:hypothetical protein
MNVYSSSILETVVQPSIPLERPPLNGLSPLIQQGGIAVAVIIALCFYNRSMTNLIASLVESIRKKEN